jgi:hypothetical protein
MLSSKRLLVTLVLPLMTIGLLIAGVATAQTQPAETADAPKWEVGINALALTDKNKGPFREIDPFGYIIKRYVRAEKGRQALRFKFSPRFLWVPYDDLSSTDNTLNVAIGYEWQQIFDRFAVLYGIEPFIRYYKLESKVRNGCITDEE